MKENFSPSLKELAMAVLALQFDVQLNAHAEWQEIVKDAYQVDNGNNWEIELTTHVLAMQDDAVLAEHKEWPNLVALAQKAKEAYDIRPFPYPLVGQRIELKKPVDRFPHFIAGVGMKGTITQSDETGIYAQMDKTIFGSESWNNTLIWDNDYVEDFFNETKKINRLSLSQIMEAVKENDLNEACLIIQNAIGQRDGGTAGMIFSDTSEDAWKAMDILHRLAKMTDYIRSEYWDETLCFEVLADDPKE